MDFDLTPDQQTLAKRMRDFAAGHVAPYRHESDVRGTYRHGLLADLAAEGLFGLRIPTAFGGSDADALSVGVVLQELAAADLSVCFPVLNASLVGGVLAANATAEQQSRWLPAIASGAAITALALTEPDHGTDAAGIQMCARRDGEDWVLDGEKTSIMSIAYATHALTFARTGQDGAHGITAFYLPLDAPGVYREILSDLGCRSGGRGRLVFDNVRVAAKDVVGPPGLGFVQVMKGFGVSRPMISLMAIGVGTAALDLAFEHARTREAFGQNIGRYQAVSFPLVEHLTFLQAARMLALEALWNADHGRDPRIPANMSKWWAPKAAMEAVHQSLLTLGHLGWTEDGQVAQRLRDVIGLQLADGTAAATKMVVARQILGRDKAP